MCARPGDRLGAVELEYEGKVRVVVGSAKETPCQYRRSSLPRLSISKGLHSLIPSKRFLVA